MVGYLDTTSMKVGNLTPGKGCIKKNFLEKVMSDLSFKR